MFKSTYLIPPFILPAQAAQSCSKIDGEARNCQVIVLYYLFAFSSFLPWIYQLASNLVAKGCLSRPYIQPDLSPTRQGKSRVECLVSSSPAV